MRIMENIVYGKLHPRQVLDVYLPEDKPIKAAYLYFHGGGLEGGDKGGYHPLYEYLTGLGVAVVAPNYRLYPEAVFPDYLYDGALAATWLFEHKDAFGAPEKVYMGGSSAGGYITMMLALDGSYLGKAGLSPDNFDGYVFDAGQTTTHYNVLRHRGEDTRRNITDEAAPLHHISEGTIKRPMLIIAADQDMPCRLAQNRLLHETLLHFGHDPQMVRLHVMQGFHHCGYLAPSPEGEYLYGALVGEFLMPNSSS